MGEAADGPSRLGETWGEPVLSQGREALTPSKVIRLERKERGQWEMGVGGGKRPPRTSSPGPYSVQRVITKVGLLGLWGAPPSLGASMAQDSW